MSEWQRYGKGRRDIAEPGVIEAFRAGGATVLQLTGRDVPDLLIGHLGATHAVEVKTDRARLRPGQARLAREWRGSPIVVARTPAQARKWLTMWRLRLEHVGGGSWQAAEDADFAQAERARRTKGEEPA